MNRRGFLFWVGVGWLQFFAGGDIPPRQHSQNPLPKKVGLQPVGTITELDRQVNC